jgi:hypothetical protein
MNKRTMALVLALSGAALPALAQQNPAPRPRNEQGARAGFRGGMQAGGAIERLLARRQELGLSADQVSRLQAVQQRVRSQSQPLVEQLRALRSDGAGRGTATPQDREALRGRAEPILRQLREQRQAAVREVQGILTADQKQKVASAVRGRAQVERARARAMRGRAEGMRGRERAMRGRERGMRVREQAMRARGRAMRGAAGQRGVVERLVARRQELGLSDAQVTQLRAIEQQLQAKNQGIEAQLRGFRPDSAARATLRARQLTEAERNALRARREQARPLVQQMMENRRQAVEQARQVLTAEQQQKVRQHVREGARRGREGQRRQPVR